MPTISPVLRITIGLLLLTVSLLLLGDLLGIVPNQKQSEIDARKIMAESLAIQISSEIGENRVEQAGKLLNIIVSRNQQVQSMGLRGNTKQLIMKSDNHESNWVDIEDDHSTANHIQVPIYENQSRWGTLEISFVPLNSMMSDLFTSRSFTAMVLFIFVFGFITYWLFLRRVLSELDPGSVVPDRVRTALDILTEGVVILDTSERIVLANDAFKKKLGFSESELLGKHLSSLPWDMENDALSLGKEKFPWNSFLETNELPTLEHLKLKTNNYGILAFDISVAPIKASHDKIKGVIVTIDDVTELEKKHKELGRTLKNLEKSKEEISRQNLELTALATFDPLSGLLNRRSLFDGLNNLLTEAHDHNEVLSCIMLDIDFFKSVNDNYGHAAGDNVIKTVSEILQEISRPQDLAGRYGGEEFVIVLPRTEESEAAQIAEKMRLTISQIQFDEVSKKLTITSSFGITSTQSNTWKADKLIDEADQALYVAKQTGRNKLVRYSQKDIDSPKIQIESERVPQKNQNNMDEKVSTLPHTLNRVEHIEKPDLYSPETLSMTEVPSRTVILDRLTQAKKLASRNKTNLAVLTIFIDTIQLTNNTLGYASAEKLKKIAFDRLIETFRLSDTVMPEVSTSKSLSLSRSSDAEFTAVLSGIEQGTD
ncbi:MAG: diguanylate cyclase, partial [Sulfurovum sp.]|nr:diguanylate cyclase [Sulfurovum sp.]NNJ44859.1 diguanylate cyclase [Sulfurovum sp.]